MTQDQIIGLKQIGINDRLAICELKQSKERLKEIKSNYRNYALDKISTMQDMLWEQHNVNVTEMIDFDVTIFEYTEVICMKFRTIDMSKENGCYKYIIYNAYYETGKPTIVLSKYGTLILEQ